MAISMPEGQLTLQFLVFVKLVSSCCVPGLVSAILQLKETDVLPVDGEVTVNRCMEKCHHILKNILGKDAIKHRSCKTQVGDLLGYSFPSICLRMEG